MFYWLLRHWVVGPFMTRVFRPWVVGLDNIPEHGGAIIAGNHLSVIDSFLMPLVIDRRVYFLAKSDYFTGKGLKGWATRMFFKATGQIPIDRSGGKASEASLNTGLQVLGRGDLLGIYPEARAAPTASSTAAAPASPAGRWRRTCRWCPSSWWTPTR